MDEIAQGAMELWRASRHVVLNALLLDLSPTYRGAGISHYQQRLLEALATEGKDWHMTALVHDRRWQPPPGMTRCLCPGFTARPVGRIFWEQVYQPWLLRRLRPTLYHGLAFAAPVTTHIPLIITVHDLSFVRFPETLPPWKARYLRWMTRHAIEKARRVIAVSESTRQDILRWLPVPPTKVVTVHNGVDAHFRPLPSSVVAEWRRRRGLPERFILYVGTLQPRKNLATLLRAYALWRQEAPAYGRDIPLVLAGARGWYTEHLFRLVEELALKAWVHFPGYLPREELPYWYNAATLFVYPSRFEGFGLPVLEAMACGTPVIAARASSLPEVVGEAGVLVSPEDVPGWATALRRVLEDKALQHHLAELARQRAAHFSWKRTAQRTLSVYDDVWA